MYKGSNFSTSLPTCTFLLFDYSHLSGCKVVSMSISLITNDAEHVFMCLLVICIIPSLEKGLFESFAHF